MPQVKSIKDADVAGKRVLLRADFNAPIQNGAVTDDSRIAAVLPTIALLRQKGAAHITILTHLGRPKAPGDAACDLNPVRERLAQLVGDMAGIELYENLRFNPGEESNDPAFAAQLAALGDIFVNDAFAVSHRAHASVVGLPKLLPSYAGLLMEKEVAGLAPALMPPVGAVAVVGGAKFETKLPLIQKLLGLYGDVLLGGALGNDLIKARGLPFGASMVSTDPVPLEVAMNERLFAPQDAVLSAGPGAERITIIADIRANERIIDIGPATSTLWAEKIAAAPFVLWNGPMGVYEEGYTRATDALAEALCKSAVRAVVGGGDTVASLQKFTFDPARVFISTGGGAMLDFLTHGTLPGLEALKA